MLIWSEAKIVIALWAIFNLKHSISKVNHRKIIKLNVNSDFLKVNRAYGKLKMLLEIIKNSTLVILAKGSLISV